MGIYLRGLAAAMAQQGLNVAQVRAFLQEVRREAVS